MGPSSGRHQGRLPWRLSQGRRSRAKAVLRQIPCRRRVVAWIPRGSKASILGHAARASPEGVARAQVRPGPGCSQAPARTAMQPVKLSISGQWWDSHIYAGRLYLFGQDGSLTAVDWDRLISDLADGADVGFA